MKKPFFVLSLIAGLTLAASAHAEIGVTGQVGTTGLSVHATVPLASRLNARFGIGYLDYKYNTKSLFLDYDYKLKTNTVDALLDWYPVQDSVFRLTGGLTYNGNKIDVHGKPNIAGSYVFSGRTYTAADAGTIDGSIDFRKVAPYLGIGWGNAVGTEKGWSFSSDVGLLFHGSPKTRLNNNGCTLPALACDLFALEVARENEALNKDASKYKVYPVLRVGVNYRF